MEASILDLRYRMKSVLEALDRGEPVTVLHRGRERARLVPIAPPRSDRPMTEHPALACGATEKIWRTRLRSFAS